MGESTSRVAFMRRCDTGGRWPGQGRRMPRAQSSRVVDLLLAARRLLDDGRLPHPEHVVDLGSARVVLRTVWAEAMSSLGSGSVRPGPGEHAR